MNRNWGKVLVTPMLAAVVLLGASHAVASPFRVGATQCGDLKKVLNADTGKAEWQLRGCDKLEALLSDPPASCGDGKVNGSELCDTALAGSCPTGETCLPNCDGCDATVRPTPVPTRTPGPGSSAPADCPQGVLPPYPLFANWLGLAQQGISDLATNTYCADLSSVNVGGVQRSLRTISVSIAEENPSQCNQYKLTAYPPQGASATSKFTTNRDPVVGFGGSNLEGRWIITVQHLVSGCAGKFSIFVKPTF